MSKASSSSRLMLKQELKNEIMDCYDYKSYGTQEIDGKKIPTIASSKISHLIPMEMMTAKDQLLLAVNTITYNDMKSILAPTKRKFIRKELYNSEQLDYVDMTSRLSLNQGDVDAFRSIASTVKKLSSLAIAFKFFNQNHISNDNIILATSYDNQNEIEHETQSLSFDNHMVIMRVAFNSHQVDIMFDCYDGGTLSHNPDVPSLSLIMSISDNPGRYENELVSLYTNNDKKAFWHYIIQFHNAGKNKPKDVLMKRSYSDCLPYVSSSCVMMGILPSNMGKE